ncbi:RHS repeat protein [Vibrio sonorensis]|uniref:RHS repeat protein n=1 Tax=Vibrio sonorensis TaxID=1004316 RepID=UPI0008DA5D6E|nr:RHS repeat protein [Vibrio sonorensis]
MVREVKQGNGVGGENTTQYSYRGYFAHQEQGLLGFGQVESINLSSNIKSITQSGFHGNWQPYIAKTETWVNHQKVAETLSQYEEANAPVADKIWPRLTNQISRTWDLSGQKLIDVTTSYGSYDGYGYAGEVTKTTLDGNGETFTEKTTTDYLHDSSRWLLGKPASISVRKTSPSDSQTRNTSFEYAVETGALIKQTLEPSHPLSVEQHFSYDRRGFRTAEQSMSSGESRGSNTTYDSQGRVVSHTNALGHSVTTSYDTLCGLPTAITDANNLTTRIEYDGFCREIRRVAPDGNWVSKHYNWSDGADAGLDQFDLTLGDRSVFMVTEQTSQGGSTTTYFDALSREVRRKALNGDGKQVIVDIAYDELGQVAGETIPYFEGLFAGDATFWVRTEYDALGRVVKKTQPTEDNGDRVTTITYRGLMATTNGPDSFVRTETTNGLGQTTEITENSQSTLNYTYDAAGNLTQTDANGLITTLTYDQFGNKIAMNDPAMGNWRYGFNGWGELIWQQDAKNQRTTYTYDAIGRKLTEVRPDGSNEWQYDQNIKGSLDQSVANDVTRSIPTMVLVEKRP